MAKIDSVYDFSDKALVELKSWLEPWFLTRLGGGRVTEITVSGPTFSEAMTTLGATSGLIGWWRLGEAAGPTFADSNPYAAACDQTQQVIGTALTPDVTGALASSQDDGAVQFAGHGGTAGDYLISGCGTRFDLGNQDFSFAAWIKPTVSALGFTGGVGGALTGGAISREGWGMDLDWPAGTLNFIRKQDGGSTETTNATVPLGAWSFVVGTYNTTAGMELYVDGVLQDSDAATFSTPTPHAGVRIGSTGDVLGTSNYFLGVIDEVSVWTSTLAAADILALYTAGISTPGSTIGISLSAGETFTVFDSSGNPIFRVDEDGDLHGLTGKALTFDL